MDPHSIHGYWPGWLQLIKCVPQVWVVAELGVVVVELLWSWVWVVMEVGVGCAQSSLQDTKPSNSLQ